jgi:hypothetical protein
MSTGLTQQLAGYGDIFAAEVDTLTRETIVGLTVLRSESDAITSPPFVTAEDAARARENALAVGDWEAYRAAFADEGVDVVYTDGGPFSVNEEMAEARFAYNAALGNRPVVESCSVTVKDSVTCTVLSTDDVMEALGAEPIVETHKYRISDGLLVFRGLSNDADTPRILQAFQEWMGRRSIRPLRSVSSFPAVGSSRMLRLLLPHNWKR